MCLHVRDWERKNCWNKNCTLCAQVESSKKYFCSIALQLISIHMGVKKIFHSIYWLSKKCCPQSNIGECYGNLWEATARFVRVTFNKLLNFYGWDFYLHNEFKFLLGLHIKKISLEFFSIWEFSQQF
jgi:hypothetical protein